MADKVNLAEKLSDVWFGRTDASVLDRYTRQRRKAQVDYVQAQTIEHKRKLEEKNPAIRRQHPGLPVVVPQQHNADGSLQAVPEGCLPMPATSSVQGQIEALWRAVLTRAR